MDGLGLHGGLPVTMTLHPSESGIHFRCGQDRVKAHPANVTNTDRQVTLGTIRTVEHVMSAFAGMGITDVEIELTSPEIPAGDGSALAFVQLIEQAGLVEIGSREISSLFRRLWIKDEERNAEVSLAGGNGHWRCSFDFGSEGVGSQTFETSRVCEDFVAHVAPAKTLVLKSQAEAAQKAGLGRGLNQSSVVLVSPQGLEGPVTFTDEIPRHKLLDAMGDLYLCGVPLTALNVSLENAGHTLHIRAASQLALALNL